MSSTSQTTGTSPGAENDTSDSREDGSPTSVSDSSRHRASSRSQEDQQWLGTTTTALDHHVQEWQGRGDTRQPESATDATGDSESPYRDQRSGAPSPTTARDDTTRLGEGGETQDRDEDDDDEYENRASKDGASADPRHPPKREVSGAVYGMGGAFISTDRDGQSGTSATDRPASLKVGTPSDDESSSDDE